METENVVFSPGNDSDGGKDDNSDKAKDDREKQKRCRVIISCLQCHSHKKKCDRSKPICGPCKRNGRGTPCDWDPRVETTVSRRGRKRVEISELNEKHKKGRPSTVEKSSSEGSDESAIVMKPSFFGMNRTSFEMMSMRYSQIHRKFGISPVSPSTLYNLYELWRTYMSTENFAVNLFVDTYDQRQALYNTYTALCAFAHSCSNSNMNMVSHAKHALKMGAEVGAVVARCMDEHGDANVDKIASSTSWLYRAMGGTPVEDVVKNIVIGIESRLESHMDASYRRNGMSLYIQHWVLCKTAMGKYVEAIESVLEYTQAALADPNLSSREDAYTKLHCLLVCNSYSSLLYAGAVGLYNPKTHMCDFVNVMYSNLPSHLKVKWDTHVENFQAVMDISEALLAEPVREGQEDDFKEMLDMYVAGSLMMGFARYWMCQPDIALPTLVYAFTELFRDIRDHPFNTPYWGAFVNAARALAMLAPRTFLRIAHSSNVLGSGPNESLDGRLSSRGLELKNIFVGLVSRLTAAGFEPAVDPPSIFEGNPPSPL